MRVLSLDVASKTGYAVFEVKNKKEKLIETGVIAVPMKDDYRGRFIQLNYKLKDLINRVKPDLVSIEELHSTRNAKTFCLLAMYLGVVHLTIPTSTSIKTINATSARSKIFKDLGHKPPKRDEIKEAVFNWAVDRYKLTDFNVKDHNDITDAILVGYYSIFYP
jgi:Holliday junction resolvasome RuvABC endonuclease subunit